MHISRRALITGSLTLAAGLITRSGAAATKATVTVYKSPT
jgi:ABC-type hemin transport system substrate-binding protein